MLIQMSSSVPARTIIIDDDERARNLLNEIISLRADVEVVGSIPEREEAVERILASHPDLLANILALAELIRELTAQQGAYLKYLPVKVREKIILRKVDDVSWFEAHGKHVQLHTGEASQVIRHALHSLESRLNPTKFIRVSRWAIINIDHVN